MTLMKDSLRLAGLQKQALEFFKNRRGRWGIYHSLSHEVSMEFLWKKPSEIEWFFPKVQPGQQLLFASSDEGFVSGYAGIREPVSRSLVGPQELDGLLVPAVAYDEEGYRLGMGQGFYDRVLKGYQGVTLGISFFELIQKKLPRDSWDRPVQFLVSEMGPVEMPPRLKDIDKDIDIEEQRARKVSTEN